MEAKLKVMEALQEEAYKGIVRIDSQTMRQIDVKPGSIVEIEGGRATVGIVDRAYPTDIGQAIIRMDGILRRNAKTGIGEVVKVRKCDIKEAKLVTIAPAQKGVMVQADPEVFKRGLLGRAVVKGDIVALGGARSRRRTMTGSPFEDIFDVFEQGFMGNFGFGGLKFIVADTNPKQAVIITETSEIRVNPKAVEVTEELAPDVTYEDIGGLSEEIKKIREMVELPLKHPEIFERLGVESPKGVLLHGPPGTGKTLLAKAVANESDANFLLINGPEVTCLTGDTEVLTNPKGRVKIQELFSETEKSGEIVRKDEFKEIVVPKQKIKLFSLNENLKIVPDEVEAITKSYAPEIYEIKTKKKGLHKTSRNHPFAALNEEGEIVWKTAKELKIGNEIVIAHDLNYSDVNKEEIMKNLDKIKLDKDEISSIDIKEGEYVYDISMKTYHNFFAGSPLTLLSNSKFYGESEKRIREIFEEAEKNAPSIIFIDEIDAIAPKREETYGEVERRMVAQLLATMDGLKSRGKVIVIGASVTGDTPIMIKDENGIKILPIGRFIDQYYKEGEENVEKNVDNIYTLGFEKAPVQSTFNQTYFDKSAFKKVRSVFRHKVDEIYELKYVGGKVRTTGNHSVFVRTKQGLKYKPVALLKPGEILVDLPYKVNSHIQKIHEFPMSLSLELPVHNIPLIEKCYEQALGGLSTNLISIESGKHSSTVNRWKREECIPDELTNSYCHLLPSTIKVTPNLMRLLGYYTAEGYAREEVDFCFGTHEEELIKDLITLMKQVFNVEPSDVKITGSRTNIVYNIKPLSNFFGTQCGKGDYNKHLPSFIFEAPREYFLEFVKGYFAGDGYKFKDNKLQVTSVSEQIIIELNWLLKMHGIKSHLSKTIAKAGRKIGNSIITKDSVGYRVNIPKTANPFIKNNVLNAKRARIKSITKLPFNDYVYDLCGCDNEAFFGGKSPILLHNTNRVNSLDPALRRPGRFDREIEIGIPSKAGRLDMLKIHTRNMPLTKDVELDKLAAITHGFVGADMAALCKEAAMNVLRKVLPDLNIKENEPLPTEILDKLRVTGKDFKEALKLVRPSALREVLIEVPNVKWKDIGGLEQLKQELKEAVEWPLKYPASFARLGIKPPKGILMYGPPGTGKTLLAKAVANESESNFILVKGPELISKWVGECLVGDTEVFTNPKGPVKIKEINKGDKVFVLDEKTRKFKKSIVKSKIISGKKKIYKLEAAGKTIEASSNHPFLKRNRNNLEWTSLENLKNGDSICIAENIPVNNFEDDRLPELNFTKINKIEYVGIKPTYDIEIENHHNFIANGFIVHNSEKGVKKIFEKARQAAPTIIFFDEVDAIAGRRGLDVGTKVTERMVNQLLTEMDGLEELTDIIVVAATNRPDMLDPALLRPGRFDRIISTTVPDKEARLEIFKIQTKDMPLAADVDLNKLADKTESYVGADIEGICREAGLLTLRANIKATEVSMKFFNDALEKVRPSIKPDDLKAYKDIEENYLRKARAAIEKPPSYLG